MVMIREALRTVLARYAPVSLKPLLLLSGLDILTQIGMLTVIYAAIEQPGESKDRLFLLFILIIVLRFMLKRRFDAHIIAAIEIRIAAIRIKVINLVRQTDLQSYEGLGSERIYTALTEDMRAISEISHTISLTTRISMTVLGILFYLLALSWAGFMTANIVLVVTGLSTLYTHVQQRAVLQCVRQQEKRVFEALRHLLSGFKELRLNDEKNEAFFQQGLQPQVAGLRRQRLRSNRHFIRMYASSSGVTIALVTTAALVLPFIASINQILLLKLISLLLFFPINVVLYEIMRFTMANVSLSRFFELERELRQIKPEPSGEDLAVFLARPQPDWELLYRQLRFRYAAQDQQSFGLGPCTLSFRAGEVVFFTGGNGSGKTTLLHVLTGLYAPEAGDVFFNGIPVEPWQYRALYSPVFQEFHLFDRLYGSENVDEQRVNALLNLMQIGHKVQYVDGQFSTLDLSSGQKKRLALVCAMLEDRPIYVFDEWAAEQDPQFRRYFYDTLLPQFKAQGKTVIAVTHDDRWFHVADRVLKMEYGQLAE